MRKYLPHIALASTLFVGMLIGAALTRGQEEGLGASTGRGGFTGVYNATTTDVVIGDGQGAAIAVDQHGRMLVSPSSTINTVGE